MSKRKLGVTMHSLEIIELQFEKERHTLLCILELYTCQIMFMNYLWKMRGYSQFSFWISITLGKIFLSCIIINQGKNTFELVGTVLKTSLFLEIVTPDFQETGPRWDVKCINNCSTFCFSQLAYVEGWKLINLANETFGFNGWSHSVTHQNIGKNNLMLIRIMCQ